MVGATPLLLQQTMGCIARVGLHRSATCSPILTPLILGAASRHFTTSRLGLSSAPRSQPPTHYASHRPLTSPHARSSPILKLLQQSRYSSAAVSADTASFGTDQANTTARPTVDASKSSQINITRPIVAYHLFFCALLVFAIIVVGGLTRLTESGLSITEWNPGLRGMRLPWTDAEWSEEWDKYRQTPEWAILNQHMTVDDFKSIYMWEWSHRILGRVIGMAFVIPAVYFVARGHVSGTNRWKLLAIASGIGFQGALGWYMVKSGLAAPDESAPALAPSHPNSTASATGAKDMRLDGATPQSVSVSTMTNSNNESNWHPRVSHFRLAAHLGTAFLVYLGMLHTGLSILRDHAVATGTKTAGGWSMASCTKDNAQRLVAALNDPRVRRFRGFSRAVAGLVFVTAMSGALVAGLDAGLVYSEFPYMGEGFVPPTEELLDERYRRSDNSNLVVANMTTNPVTVQLMHRCLAITTLCSVLALGWRSRVLSSSMLKTSLSPPAVGRNQVMTAALPPTIPRMAMLASLAAVTQASLGISTLIYLVPIELASLHQAGSVVLLSAMCALLVSLRSPSRLALLARQALRSSSSSSPASGTASTSLPPFTASNAEIVSRALKRVQR